jgi:hypothetical protein
LFVWELQPPLVVAAILEKTDHAILVKLFLENNGVVDPEADGGSNPADEEY